MDTELKQITNNQLVQIQLILGYMALIMQAGKGLVWLEAKKKNF